MDRPMRGSSVFYEDNLRRLRAKNAELRQEIANVQLTTVAVRAARNALVPEIAQLQLELHAQTKAAAARLAARAAAGRARIKPRVGSAEFAFGEGDAPLAFRFGSWGVKFPGAAKGRAS